MESKDPLIAIYTPSEAAFEQFGTSAFLARLHAGVGSRVAKGDTLVSFNNFFDEEMRDRVGVDPPALHAPVAGQIVSFGATLRERLPTGDAGISDRQINLRGDELVLLIKPDPDQNLRRLQDEDAKVWIDYALRYREEKLARVWWTRLFNRDWQTLKQVHTREKVETTRILELVQDSRSNS